MDAVTETVRLKPDRIRPIKNNEGFPPVAARPRRSDLSLAAPDGP